MFGLSLPKILVLALIVAAIWYGYKWVGRLDRERKAKLREGVLGESDAVDHEGEDLVKCTLCGTYGTSGISRCPEGRDDCPLVKG